jgi:hypothetical protein
MCINEAFHYATRKARRKKPDTRFTITIFTCLTLIAFILAEVPFRSNDVPTAMRVFAGIAGLNGTGLGGAISVSFDGAIMMGFIIAGGLICFLFPNTEQIMTRVTPALEWARWRNIDPAYIRLIFRFNGIWLTIVAFALFLGFVFITRGTQKFIYFNF